MINNEIYTLRDVSQKIAGRHIIRTVICTSNQIFI